MSRSWVEAFLVAAVIGSGCGEAPDGTAIASVQSRAVASPSASALAVETRNLYLGTDVAILLQAASPAQVPALVQQAFLDVQNSKPAERAEAWADEIAATRPHLVGLQEVALLRTQFPGDSFTANPTPATTVAYDFLTLLEDALAARGLDYQAVAVAENIDIELPSADGKDIRLTDRDVLLARGDVGIDQAQAHTFNARLVVQVGGVGGPVVSIPRGWVEADATVGPRTVHFASTHLESVPLYGVQLAQAGELLAGLSGEPLPTVLVGDFNSAADGSSTPTYAALLDGTGFVDAWAQSRSRDPGFTCCQAAELLNPVSQLDERIDLVLVRQPGTPGDRFVGSAQLTLVGEDPGDRTPSGLWPSDHAGVAARLQLPLGGRYLSATETRLRP